MIPEGLPPQFMNWKIVKKFDPKTETWKDTKAPCKPDGEVVTAHDPSHWMSAEQAAANGLGVAFVLTKDDPWFFLDLDKCYDITKGAWSAESSAIFQSFSGAWGEVSQSGRGLHIMGRANAETLRDRKRKWNGWLEFYTEGRFIAFGGQGWSRIGGVANDRDWTDQLLHIVPKREDLGPLPSGIDPSYTGPEDDETLLKMAMRSENVNSRFGKGCTFKDLWEGNEDVLSVAYPDASKPYDASAADQALTNHLAFWTGRDMPRMDALFRQSALLRDKWDTVHRHDGATYGRMTIESAARICKRVFDRPKPEPKRITSTGVEARHEVFLSIGEMIQHFEGCVYVRDVHRVLIPDGELLKPAQFDATYGGHLFTMFPDDTKPSKSAFEAFTQNACHRFPQAKTTIFRPQLPFGEMVGHAVNVYLEPEVELKQGDISRFTDFLEKLLPDENDRAILVNYMAAVVQNPGVKFQWTPVLQGAPGNGKTLAATCVAHAIGEQYTYTPRSSQLGNRFNSWLEHKCFIIVEEFHMKGRRDILDELKPLITNLRVEAEGKGVDGGMIDNLANWFCCTNHLDAVLTSGDDRRYAIFYTAQQSYEDIIRDGMGGSYFPSLYKWLREEGGYGAVAQWLTNYMIRDDLNPAGACHRAPITSSTHLAVAISQGPIEQEIQDAVDSGRQGFGGGFVNSFDLNKLMKEKGNKITLSKIGIILRGMGYSPWGRAPKPVIGTDMQRPSIWYKGDPSTVSFEDCMKSQGWH